MRAYVMIALCLCGVGLVPCATGQETSVSDAVYRRPEPPPSAALEPQKALDLTREKAQYLQAVSPSSLTTDERLALSRLQTRVYAVHDAHKDAVLKLQRAQQDVDKLTKQIEQVKAEYGIKVVELRKKYNKDANCEITVNTQEWDCPKTASK